MRNSDLREGGWVEARPQEEKREEDRWAGGLREGDQKQKCLRDKRPQGTCVKI